MLRARIADGQLPEGTVDNRSISDVPAREITKYNQVHLFAGIGGFPLALEMCNFGRSRSICTAGFPCTDLSAAGKGAGLEGKASGLWWETFAAISWLRPDVIFVENVSALLTRGVGTVLGPLATLGYRVEWHCVPAAYVGAPHRRDRIWIVGTRDVVADTQGDQGLGGGGTGWGEQQQSSGEGSGHVADTKVSGKRTRLREGESTEKRGRRSGNIGGEDEVADTDSRGCGEMPKRKPLAGSEAGPTIQSLADTIDSGPQGGLSGGQDSQRQPGQNGWPTECRLGIHPDGLQPGLDNDCGGWECGVPRIAKGQKDRTKRLKALGNAIVPQCAAFVLNHVLGDLHDQAV